MNSKIRFRFNAEKAVEVILWCATRRRRVDVHTILKVLLGADDYHLNTYGRPVVGDHYRALTYGPVPQQTYDLLKGDPLALEFLGEADVPFMVEQGRFVVAKRGPDSRKLSKSDIEALEHGWAEFANLGFNGRTDKSHRHPAYRRAEEAGTLSMRYEDFIRAETTEERDRRIADLKEIAHRMVI